MATKIKGELEQKLISLAQEGHNCRQSALRLGLDPETVRQWAIRKNVSFQTGSLEYRLKEPKLIELLKNGYFITKACKEVGIDIRDGKEWAIKNGLSHLIRDRADAAKDKQISVEDAQKRVPQGHGNIVKYDPDNGTYMLKREDGTAYTRILSQLFRGDPQLSSRKRETEEEVSQKLLIMGYRLIAGTYIKKHESVRAEHITCGYIRETSFYQFNSQECPRCSNTGTSKEEKSLDDWIKTLGINTKKFFFKRDYSGKGKSKEIDIYAEELGLGIEYCGFYRHGERQTLHSLETKIKKHAEKEEIYEKTRFDSPIQRHKAKMDKANSIGIRLITIFQHEWKNSEEKVKSVLRAKLGKNENSVFARKTKIKEIDTKISKDFLNTYHLQGGCPSIVRFGLFNGEDLVAVITGGYHHRSKGAFVLNRLCFKANTTVVGGASKLNKALESWAKINGYMEILSWSDNRWSDGGIYVALGYELQSEMPPDYFYFDNKGNTYSKQSCQKKNLIKKGAIGNTEFEMAQSLGYDRIWDCGKKTWVKKLI